MNTKSLAMLPALALLTACGGSSTGGVSYETLQNAPAGSVRLSADAPVNAENFDVIAAVDFDNSAVGSTLIITEGDYAGVELTKVESRGGKSTLLISTPNSYESTSAIRGEINTYLQAAIRFSGQNGVESDEKSEVINGTQIYFTTETFGVGTTNLEESYIGIYNEQTAVKAVVSVASIGGETTFALGANRDDESNSSLQYSSPQAGGTYSYEGIAIAFEEEDSYTDTTASMDINFDNSTGTFSANNFVPDEDASAKNINITSNLSINNAAGTISSTSGTITVGNSSSDLALNGIIAFDNSAVAGAMLPTAETDGVVGGIFVLPQNP